MPAKALILTAFLSGRLPVLFSISLTVGLLDDVANRVLGLPSGVDNPDK